MLDEKVAEYFDKDSVLLVGKLMLHDIGEFIAHG